MCIRSVSRGTSPGTSSRMWLRERRSRVVRPSDIAVIVPVMTIVGDTDEERDAERERVRCSA